MIHYWKNEGGTRIMKSLESGPGQFLVMSRVLGKITAWKKRKEMKGEKNESCSLCKVVGPFPSVCAFRLLQISWLSSYFNKWNTGPLIPPGQHINKGMMNHLSSHSTLKGDKIQLNLTFKIQRQKGFVKDVSIGYDWKYSKACKCSHWDRMEWNIGDSISRWQNTNPA